MATVDDVKASHPAVFLAPIKAAYEQHGFRYVHQSGSCNVQADALGELHATRETIQAIDKAGGKAADKKAAGKAGKSLTSK